MHVVRMRPCITTNSALRIDPPMVINTLVRLAIFPGEPDAMAMGDPLLFKGEDFSKTDVARINLDLVTSPRNPPPLTGTKALRNFKRIHGRPPPRRGCSTTGPITPPPTGSRPMK